MSSLGIVELIDNESFRWTSRGIDHQIGTGRIAVDGVVFPEHGIRGECRRDIRSTMISRILFWGLPVFLMKRRRLSDDLFDILTFVL